MALLDNLQVFWELESNGNDSHSVGPYHLTAVNSPTHTTGRVGNAGAFNGSSYPNVQIYHVADTANLSPGDFDWSIGLWLYLTAVNQTRCAISKWGASTATYKSYTLYYDHINTAFRCSVANGTSSTEVYATNFGAASVDTWYYVAFGHRAGTDRAWIAVNAGTADTQAHTGGTLDGAARIVLGGQDTDDGGLTDAGWNGRIDQVGFWTRDITSDLATLYNGGSGLSYAAMSPAAAGHPTMRRWGSVPHLGGRSMSPRF